MLAEKAEEAINAGAKHLEDLELMLLEERLLKLLN